MQPLSDISDEEGERADGVDPAWNSSSEGVICEEGKQERGAYKIAKTTN